jgi:hypothetical protein
MLFLISLLGNSVFGFKLGAVWLLRILYIDSILYTLDSASNYSAIQKLKP